MKKIIIINLIFLAAMCGNVLAQNHELSASLGGGFSTLSYKLSPGGTRNGGGGIDFGVGYTFFRDLKQVAETGTIRSDQWGIHSALGFSLYNAVANVDGETIITSGLLDNDTHLPIAYRTFNMHTTLANYKEKQSMMLLNIPVMGVLHLKQYYAMAGFKFGIPVGGKYKYERATLTNAAEYPETENWARMQEFMGLGVFQKDAKEKMKYGVSTMLSLEGGMIWTVLKDMTLYVGAYFDYGLNNIAKKFDDKLLNYDAAKPADFTTNSVLSVYTQKVNVVSVGVKVRLAMNL